MNILQIAGTLKFTLEVTIMQARLGSAPDLLGKPQVAVLLMQMCLPEMPSARWHGRGYRISYSLHWRQPGMSRTQENWTHGGQSTGHLSGAVASSTCRWGAAAGREQS